ncbi:chitinase [Kitasatospora sp. NPDC087861]|uniref:chitinase n=1 Tax=Kitasatospora sp. NPDC087861 TaxID=3364070 RepID=UPI0037FC6AD2
MSKHRLSRRRRIAAAATALAAGGVLIVAQNDAPAAATDPVGLNAVYEYLGWGESGAAQDPVEVMKATGIRQFTLAFLLAGQGCEPAWDGERALTGSDEEAKIKAIRAAGGDVVASFGGWDGAKLGEKCTDATQLAAAYQKVIDAYQLKAIDIDIESTELTGAESRQRVVDALKAGKAKNPGLRVYVTFSTEENGPDADGTDLITKAAKAGLEVDGWVVMPFDFDRHSGSMVDATKSALSGLQQALVKAYGYDQDTAWRHAGLSSINGHSDSPDEVVSPADFQAMRDFAAAHHLARFTFWAVNRDRSCAGTFSKDTASKCGGIQQSPYEFTKIVAGYHVDSKPSDGAAHCPGPVGSPSPEVTATRTGPTTKPTDDAEDTASPSATPRHDAETRTPISGTPYSPRASASQSRRLAATEAKRVKGTPQADDSDDSGDDTPDPKVTTAQPADPSESPAPAKPKKKTPKPTTPPASPTATTTGAPATGTQAPSADCSPTADPVVTPTTTPTTPAATPSTTATSAPTGQPSSQPTGRPTTTRPTEQPTPTRPPAPGPTTQAPAPVVTPTTTPTATASATPAPTASPTATPTAPVAAAAPATTPPGEAHGQPLASTGGGGATSVVVAGAGALLLIGGAFGMVGTRRRRGTEETQ